MANDIPEKEINLQDLLIVLNKRKWLILISTLVCGATALFVSLRMRPIYRATATLLIEKESPKIVSIEDVTKIETSEQEYFQTQIQILKSRSLAHKVIEKLNLERSLLNVSSADSVSSFLACLRIEPIGGSRVVKVSFEGEEPKKIAEIVNTLTETYIEQTVEARLDTSKQALLWLKEQLETQKKKLEKSELALQKYMEKNRITDLPKIEEQGRLIDTLREKEAQLEIQLAELSKRYKEKHPKIVRLMAEIQSVKQKIQEETERTLRLKEITIQYNILKRDVEKNHELYDILLKRVKETGISEELPATNVRIVDPAEVPNKPVKPKKRMYLLLGSLLGLFAGVFFSFILEFAENTIKTPDDIKEYIEAPFLGAIPSAKKEANSIQEIDLISYHKPKSIITESFRIVRTEILRNSQGDTIKTLLVTSTLPQEGKTSVATNLAIVFTQNGEKVLLLEADIRKPRLKKTFNFDNPRGLSDYLLGKAEIDLIIQSTEIPNLKVIISGDTTDYEAELLNSEKMKELLNEVRKNFDRIIVDSPPVLSVADSLILADNVDGIIQIVKTDAVKKSSCLFAKQKLSSAKGKYIGVVLNYIELKKEQYYYPYYYYSPYPRS